MTKNFKLDPHSPMPLYYQVYTSIMERVATTEFKVNQLLPSERILTEQYDVSRITISRAMDLLKKNGVVRLHHGKGHFVNSQKLHNDPTWRVSITEHMRQQGANIHWRVLNRQWLDGPDIASVGMKLPAKRKLYQAQLLLLSEDKPLGFHYVYVPGKIARAGKVDTLSDRQLLDFLRDAPIAANCQLERSVDAMLADGNEATVLQMEKGAALMRIDIRYLSQTGSLVQSMRSYYRGDSFSYKF